MHYATLKKVKKKKKRRSKDQGNFFDLKKCKATLKSLQKCLKTGVRRKAIRKMNTTKPEKIPHLNVQFIFLRLYRKIRTHLIIFVLTRNGEMKL
jgi:hypothetical protein